MKIKRWHGLALWALVTLWAIGLIGEALYAAVTIALFGGAACGVVQWYAGRALEARRDEEVV
jgi:hypothetical protein